MARDSKTTIDDIARAVGVSKTTISRYINGHGEMMSEKTRERVRAAIELTNYQPSDIARNLKRKKTNLIGVLISDMSTPFSSALIIAIGDYLAERGYVPIFANCDDSLQKEEELIDMLISKGVAGLLVNTTSSQNNHLIGVASRGCATAISAITASISSRSSRKSRSTISWRISKSRAIRGRCFSPSAGRKTPPVSAARTLSLPR